MPSAMYWQPHLNQDSIPWRVRWSSGKMTTHSPLLTAARAVSKDLCTSPKLPPLDLAAIGIVPNCRKNQSPAASTLLGSQPSHRLRRHSGGILNIKEAFS